MDGGQTLSESLNEVAIYFNVTLSDDALYDLTQFVDEFFAKEKKKSTDYKADNVFSYLCDSIYNNVFEAFENDGKMRSIIYKRIAADLLEMAEGMEEVDPTLAD